MAEAKIWILCSPQPDIGEYYVDFEIGGHNSFERKLLGALPGAIKTHWDPRGRKRQVCGFHFPLGDRSPQEVIEVVDRHARMIAGRGKVVIHEPIPIYPSWFQNRK